MKQVLMFTSLKGGVGKTTAASAIAFALSFFGKKVLCADLDFGVRGLDLALGAENACAADVLEVIQGGYDPLAEAILVRENLYFLPAPALFNTREAGVVTSEELSAFLARAKSEFDFVLLDLPAGGGELFLPLAKSPEMTGAIVVSTAESAALRAAEQTAFEIRSASSISVKLIINRVPLKTKSPRSLFDSARAAALPVLGVIPEDPVISEAYDAGVAPTRLPQTPSAQAYWNISSRMLGAHVPLFTDVVSSRRRKRLCR